MKPTTAALILLAWYLGHLSRKESDHERALVCNYDLTKYRPAPR